MVFALISAVLLILLVLIAIRFGINRNVAATEVDAEKQQTLHASGIYSIVRSSPREFLLTVKPRLDDLRKYISTLNEDINSQVFTENDKSTLLHHWEDAICESIQTIEKGDENEITFYYYDFIPSDCPVCKGYLSKGKFVTREEIFLHPVIIPPFHLGCTCKIIAHHGKESLRETTELGMLPLFKNQKPPALPDWKTTVKL